MVLPDLFPERADEIVGQHDISEVAVWQHSAYLASVQPSLEVLVATYDLDAVIPAVDNPEEPGNRAEYYWRMGWITHLNYLKEVGLESTPERAYAAIDAARLCVASQLERLNGEPVQLVVPSLYRLHMPKKFGDAVLLGAA